jgi:hypothetical protein
MERWPLVNNALMKNCPCCRHDAPAIYFGSSGHCFDCILGHTLTDDETPTAEPKDVLRKRLSLPSHGDVDEAWNRQPEVFCAAFDGMTPRSKTALVGYYLDLKTLTSIAREAGTKTPAVSRALARAIDHLRHVGILPPAEPAVLENNLM